LHINTLQLIRKAVFFNHFSIELWFYINKVIIVMIEFCKPT